MKMISFPSSAPQPAARETSGAADWIGVYGDFHRHDRANPGTFTILINRDYPGLHAEAGIQIDGGKWEVHPMRYAGNVDGNSVWFFVPSQPFPNGAVVRFFFHGWDEWGKHLWDCNHGDDYLFAISIDGTNLVEEFDTPPQSIFDVIEVVMRRRDALAGA